MGMGLTATKKVPDRFDFLGYHLTRRGLRAAAVTIGQSFAHVRRDLPPGKVPVFRLVLG
jgi:hypothetical protein